MAVGDVAQLSVQGLVTEQTHVHTLHFRYLTAGASEAGLAAAWNTAAQATYRACFTTEDTPIQSITARQVCGTIPFRVPGSAAPTGTLGTRTASSQAMPALLAQVTRLQTAFSGKRYRGRYFLGGIREEDVQGNFMLTGAGGRFFTLVPAYNAALMAAFGPAGTSADYRWVVYSQRLRDLGSTCVASANEVVTQVGTSLVSTQRSRKPGSGV